ncbi:MAG: glutathione peroxidase [Cyclobacteriaceae bacterium]
MLNLGLIMLSMIMAACFGSKKIESKPENAEIVTEGKTLHDFKMKSIEGEEIDLSMYKGKKVLLVNVASKCGYTKQYKDLQALHEKHGDKVVILGFPANNFGGQEPGSNEEIAEFCTANYGVGFQMFEKISVKGADTHPLYRWLSDKSQNGWNEQAPSWNFCKYLVNEEGELLRFYASAVNPMDAEVIADINS